MPEQVRRFIKTGIAFLVLGVLLGLWMLIRRELFGDWPQTYTVSAHTHALFVGFVLFMILGVALWLFPKALDDDRRYTPARIEAVYVLLLLGTALRVGAELLRAYSTAAFLPGLVVLGGVAQVSGLLLYVWAMWRRIRPSARALRLARGEPD